MAYLLDSDIVIRYLADDDQITGQVRPLFERGCSISVISYIEVRHGFLALPVSPDRGADFEALLMDAPLIPVTVAVAERCAVIRVELTRQGRRIRSRALDLIVAATALEHGLTLVTRNTDDYRDIPGLSLYDTA